MRETLQLGNIDTNKEITLIKIKIAELVLKLRPKNTVFRHCDGNTYFNMPQFHQFLVDFDKTCTKMHVLTHALSVDVFRLVSK